MTRGAARRVRAAALLAPLLGAVVAPAAAPLGAQRGGAGRPLEVTALMTLVELRTRARLDGASIGDGVDGERDLGLDRLLPSPALRVRWRLSRRNELELGAQRIRRTATRTLAGTVTWGDSTFPAGAAVRARFDSDNLVATWRTALHLGDRTEWGLGVGAGVLLVDAGLAAGAGIGDTSGALIVRRAVGVDFPAPIASVGGYGRWRPTEGWRLDLDLRALAAAPGRLRADVLSAHLLVRRQLGRRWALEGGGAIDAFLIALAPARAGARTDDLGLRARYRQLQAQIGLVVAP